MAVFNFTVRATDSEGSYADRQFNITVRNSRVERFMILDTADAWTSPDGTTWSQRSGQGGISCAYGNGFWMVLKSNTNMSITKSTDGINYTYIASSAMTFLDEAGSSTTAPTSFVARARLKFWNGKFWILILTASGLDLWSSSDGITWQRKRLYAAGGGVLNYMDNNYCNMFTLNEDNGSLFIPFPCDSGNSPLNGFSNGLGWMTSDGTALTQIKNVSNSSTTVGGCGALTRVNGVYFAQNAFHNNSKQTGQFGYIYSTDGINWTVGNYGSTTIGSTSAFQSIPMFYANGTLFLYTSKNSGSTAGHYVYTSVDGLAWTEAQIKLFGTASSYVIPFFKNGVYLLTCSAASGTDMSTSITTPNNGFRVSVDGVNWTFVNVRASGTTYSYTDVAAM